MNGSPGHLLGLAGCPPEAVRSVLALARRRREEPEGVLAGRVVALLFFEDSTRTKTSFAIAARRCGASVVDLGTIGSSVSKGESLVDTARVVEAMGVAAIVVRAGQSGAAKLIADSVGCAVLNGGDGTHEHPTQALADALALDDAWSPDGHGTGSFDFTGRRVVIVGDLAHSRVARANAACLSALGAQVVLVGPPTMAPRSLETLGVRVSHDFDGELEAADAVMMLRVQFERGATLASSREYRSAFGLTAERAGRMKGGAVVMHPGPVNRGLEIDPEVADAPNSIILRQVAAGVAVRTAALETLVAELRDR